MLSAMQIFRLGEHVWQATRELTHSEAWRLADLAAAHAGLWLADGSIVNPALLRRLSIEPEKEEPPDAP